jgi:hypothetical protein
MNIRPSTPAPVHRAEWFDVLNSLSIIDDFCDVSFFYDLERVSIEENDERACDILNLCPRMRQVEHWDLVPSYVIALEREGDRVVWKGRSSG